MTLMIDNGLRIQGSLVASSHDIGEMLQFCAKNNLAPVIERFPLSNEGVQEAIEALSTQSIRYKAVLSSEG
jgi:D-arabinose 1-dehydrogenase-like Zn-dependent alcohol dehydrogenase